MGFGEFQYPTVLQMLRIERCSSAADLPSACGAIPLCGRVWLDAVNASSSGVISQQGPI
jgi:hypothetical protein